MKIPCNDLEYLAWWAYENCVRHTFILFLLSVRLTRAYFMPLVVMPKRYCGPSPFNGRMARRECQRCVDGSTLCWKMFLSSHSPFTHFFSFFHFSYSLSVSTWHLWFPTFFPSSFWLCGLNWGWRRPKSLSERFGAFHMVALGLGRLGQSHLLRCCRQIHGVETHSICFGRVLPNPSKFYHDVHRYVIYLTVFGAPGELMFSLLKILWICLVFFLLNIFARWEARKVQGTCGEGSGCTWPMRTKVEKMQEFIQTWRKWIKEPTIMFSPAFLFKFSRSREYHSEEGMFSAKSQEDMVNCQFEILKISPQKLDAATWGKMVRSESVKGWKAAMLFVSRHESELSRTLNPCWKSTDYIQERAIAKATKIFVYFCSWKAPG